MKKATVASTAVWLTAALLMIAYQIVGQSWLKIANGICSHVMTWVFIGMLAASLGLMKSVDRRELFPSRMNTRARNTLNIFNFIASITAALSFFYLAGALGAVDLHSALFSVAVTALLVGTAFQGTFALVTKQQGADQAKADGVV